MQRRTERAGTRAGPRLRAATTLLACLALAAVALLAPHPGYADPEESAATIETYRLRVQARGPALDRLAAGGYDIAGRDLRAGWVEIIADRAQMQTLADAGYAIEVLEQRERPAVLRPAPGDSPTGRPQEQPLQDQTYTDYGEMEQYLQQVVADHPAITRLESIGTSIEGRTIWALLISDNAAVDEDEPAILFNAAHHAREVMTPEVMIDMIDQLTDGYGVDPAMTARVDAYEIWCVPMVNPDGVEIVFTADDLWRKNARDNDDNGRITWKDGVDLNRNYPWGWGGQCQGSSEGETQATYRGPAEGSEPEVAALMALGRRIHPVFYVEYHTYGEDVFYAMGCDPEWFSPQLSTISSGPDQSISRVIGEQYAARMLRANGQPGFIPAPFGSRVDGIGRDYHAHQSGALGFVVEMNAGYEGFHPIYSIYRQPTVEGQRPAWTWLIDRIGGPAIGGHVVDAVTGQPLVTDLDLDEMTLPDGRRLTTNPATGRYHVIVVPGSYTLRVSAPGYADAVVPVTVGAAWDPLDVALVPDGSTRVALETFEDDTSSAAWTLDPADDAVAGQWVRGVPHGTHSGTVETADLTLGATGFDRTAGPGGHAFVTGNAPAALLDDDDVDGGTTTLVSPAYDLAPWYGVEVSAWYWLRSDPADPADCFDLEVSTDGGTVWSGLASHCATSMTPDASAAWVRLAARLDDVAAPAVDTRLRFRVSDLGVDNVVEAAVDDVEIRGFDRALGVVSTLRFPDGSGAVEWDAVPGAADATYELVRGDLANLVGDGDEIDLGPLTCVEAAAAGQNTVLQDGSPPEGTGWFYLARFHLGLTTGPWGAASDGTLRNGPVSCP